MRGLWCLCGWGLGTLLVAAAPTVSNREPQPGEVGYRPADGQISRLNPPSFIWLHEPEAVAYTIQWASRPDFSDAVTAGPFPLNTHTHTSTFVPGAWLWRYRFATADGAVSDWSAVRTVQVPPEAIHFPMPNRAQQRERIPTGRPRLFLRPSEVPRLRELVRTGSSARFAPLQAEADRLLGRDPTPEPAHLGSARDKENQELVRYWWPNREQTLRACQEAEVLAFVYLMTGDKRYGEAARRWILHLASWDPDGPTNFTLNCEAAKPLLHRLPRAYDWAHDTLSAEDRARVQQVMRRRALDAWESWEVKRGVGHLTQPYGSHANRVWHKLGECGVAFLGEIPEAETWLDYAVNKFHACYPVWSDDDGGWHEGLNYWGGYMSKAVWWLQAAQIALGVDGLQKPFFAQVGDFALYLAPPHAPNMGFGDLSFRTPPAGWGGFMEYFIRTLGSRSPDSRAPYWRWWTQQWQMRDQEGILGFLYEATLPPLPEPKPPSDLPVSKVFRGVGVASLHTTLLDGREDVHFLFKSSPFGTQSHGHNPHNSFQLNAYGEALLTTCVYRDLHGSKFHYGWAHQTRAHNAVLVNGEGQTPHTPAPHGAIVDAQLTPGWDYVVGDATPAYGPRLARYRRHVAFVKPDLIVIYDDLAATQPATFQFLLHALGPFEIDPARSALTLQRPGAGLAAQYFSPLPLSFRQWDGYDPEPLSEVPNQWHVEASTQEKRSACGMLTVLIPWRGTERPDWTAERLETDTAIGVRVQRAGKSATVAFRKPGTLGQASLGDRDFSGGFVTW